MGFARHENSAEANSSHSTTWSGSIFFLTIFLLTNRAVCIGSDSSMAEDVEGKASVTYGDLEYLRDRHGVPRRLIKNLAGAGVVRVTAVE